MLLCEFNYTDLKLFFFPLTCPSLNKRIIIMSNVIFSLITYKLDETFSYISACINVIEQNFYVPTYYYSTILGVIWFYLIEIELISYLVLVRWNLSLLYNTFNNPFRYSIFGCRNAPFFFEAIYFKNSDFENFNTKPIILIYRNVCVMFSHSRVTISFFIACIMCQNVC